MNTMRLMFVCLVVSMLSAAAATTNETSTTVSVNRKPMFRAFKLVKLGFIIKTTTTTTPMTTTTTTTKAQQNKSVSSLLKNPFMLVRPLSPWILLAPPKTTKSTTTTTTTTTTMASTTKKAKSTINPTLATHCEEICQRNVYSGKYVNPCSVYKHQGKHYLCYVCRHRMRVCQALARGGLFK